MAYGPPTGVVSAVERFAPGFWGEFITAANESFRGIRESQVTSWWRTAARNRSVGGLPDSQHLVGAAFDVAGPPVEIAELAVELRAYGFRVEQYSSHLHAQAWAPGAARRAGLLRYLGL